MIKHVSSIPDLHLLHELSCHQINVRCRSSDWAYEYIDENLLEKLRTSSNTRTVGLPKTYDRY